MLRKLSYFILCFSTFGQLLSCTVPVYDVDKLNTPLYSKRGDISVEGGFGFTGYSGTAGYALTDHIALSGHVNYSHRNTSDSDLHYQTLFEGIATYYTAPKDGLAWYLGAGFSRCSFDYRGVVGNFMNEDTYYKTFGSYNKYSIQGSLTTKIFDIASTILDTPPPRHQLEVRVSYIDYQSYEYYTGYSPSDLQPGTLEDNRVYIEFGSTHIFPMFNVENLYLTAQWGLVAPLDGKDYVNVNPFIGSIGIQYLMNFSKRGRKEY